MNALFMLLICVCVHVAMGYKNNHFSNAISFKFYHLLATLAVLTIVRHLYSFIHFAKTTTINNV